MKVIVKIFDIALAIYFVVIAIFYFVIGAVKLVVDGTWWEYLQAQGFWYSAVIMIAMAGWIFTPYVLMGKKESKYNYAMVVLIMILLGSEIYKFVVTNNYQYSGINSQNAILLGLPIVLILVTYYLNRLAKSKER